MIKQIMIPVAAFAVTITTASAFNPDMLSKIDVDLTDTQLSALETAHTMKDDGADRDDIKAYLEDNGVDADTMKEIKEATRTVRDTQREAVQTAIENGDYSAFAAAIADSPLADSVTSESDFEKFAEAHALREAGDHEGAKEIMAELGIEMQKGHGEGRGGERGEGKEGKGSGEGRGFGGPGQGDRQSARTE